MVKFRCAHGPPTARPLNTCWTPMSMSMSSADSPKIKNTKERHVDAVNLLGLSLVMTHDLKTRVFWGFLMTHRWLKSFCNRLESKNWSLFSQKFKNTKEWKKFRCAHSQLMLLTKGGVWGIDVRIQKGLDPIDLRCLYQATASSKQPQIWPNISYLWPKWYMIPPLFSLY